LNEINIIAPGRVCLFGDHQDYLSLPVIAATINKYIKLSAVPISENKLIIHLKDFKKTREIDLKETFQDFEARDYFASGIRYLRKQGIVIDKGYQIEIEGDIPINAGASSSSALVSAWVLFLLKAFKEDAISKKNLSMYTHHSETVEHQESGGKMDQYSISTGGVLYINTTEEYDLIELSNSMEGLILVDSKVPKDTLTVLKRAKGNAVQAIEILKNKIKNYDIKRVNSAEIDEHLKYLNEELQPYYIAAVNNFKITEKALSELQKEKPDKMILSELMNQHHRYLKENLKITVPEIDEIVNFSLKNGALSAKINGSGGGGTVLVYAPNNRDELIKKLNGIDYPAIPIDIGEGTKVL
jgi:galactokinase